MTNDTVLRRIRRGFFDVEFGSTSLLPLGETLTLSPVVDCYDGKLFSGGRLGGSDFLLSHEMKIEIETKHIENALSLLGAIASGELFQEAELRFTPRDPVASSIIFGHVRLCCASRWRLNTGSDQSILLEFIARPDENGKLFYRT